MKLRRCGEPPRNRTENPQIKSYRRPVMWRPVRRERQGDERPTCSRPDCRIIATTRGCNVQVCHRLFRSTIKSWEKLCQEAAAFATTVGKDRLINISVAQGDTGGVIFVWYWE